MSDVRASGHTSAQGESQYRPLCHYQSRQVSAGPGFLIASGRLLISLVEIIFCEQIYQFHNKENSAGDDGVF